VPHRAPPAFRCKTSDPLGLIVRDLQMMAGNSVPDLAEKVAAQLQVPLMKLTLGRFSDGEVELQASDANNLRIACPFLPNVYEGRGADRRPHGPARRERTQHQCLRDPVNVPSCQRKPDGTVFHHAVSQALLGRGLHSSAKPAAQRWLACPECAFPCSRVSVTGLSLARSLSERMRVERAGPSIGGVW